MKTLHTIYTNFAKRVLMALALITMGVGTAWGTEETWSHTFANGNLPKAAGTVELTKKSWEHSAADYMGWDSNNNRGIQIGSGSYPVSSYTLSTSDFSGTITKVVVNASMASSASATLKVSVDGTIYGNQNLSTTATNYTFSGTKSGEIVITFNQPSTKKALYIKSISVTYVVADAQQYTLSYQAGDGIGTLKVEEGANLLNALDVLGTPTSCDAESTEFIGWTTTEITAKTNDVPLLLNNSSVMPSSDYMVYAVFAKKEGEQTLISNQKTTISGNTSGETSGVLSWSSEKNNAANYPIWSSDHYRFYYSSDGNGCSMSIKAEDGVTITGITITATGTSYTPTVKYNIDGGSEQEGSWASTTITITDLSAESFKFRNANKENKQLRFKNVEVTYSKISGEYTYSDYITTCSAEVTVTLDPDGGTGTFKNWITSGDNYTMTVDAGTEITLPELSKTGYDFAGWHDGTATVTSPYTPTTDITLTAQWTAQQYNITYKDQGDNVFSGNHTMGHPTKHTYGTATTLKDATKTGYTFAGWYKEPTCMNKVTTLGATDYTSNITLYAQWTANTYTVQFDANGGTGTMDNQSFTYDANPKALSANTFTRIGYNFTGWNTAADGTGTPYTDKAEVKNLTAELNGVVTLYAQWEEKQLTNFRTSCSYTATWQVNGGKWSDGTAKDIVQEYNMGATITPPTNPKHTGYTFAGWDPAVPATMPAEDIIFTAIWENCRWVETDIDDIHPDDEVVITMTDALSNSYTLRSDIDDEVLQAIEINNTISFTNNYIWIIGKEGDNLTFESYEKSGYFLICNNADDGVRMNNKSANKTFVVDDTYGYLKNTQTTKPRYLGVHNDNHAWYCYALTNAGNFPLKIAGQTLKLYKRVCIEENQHWVTWDANGGLFADGSTTKTDFFTVGTPINHPTPTREGYTFTGWTPATNTMPNEDITLVAQWKINSYTVTWNANGGKFGNETSIEQSYTYGATITAPADPTRIGYTFAGWNPAPAVTMPASHLTYNAEWNCTSPTDIKINGAYIVFPGETIQLTVTGNNIADDATYTWKKGDQIIAGQTTATLTIPNCVVGDAANYKCVVSNGTCSAENNFTVKMYRLRGLTDGDNWTTDFVFSKAEGNTATYEITLNGESNYRFKVFDGTDYYGNNEGGDNTNPTMTHDNCTNWVMQQNKGYDVTLSTTITGVYTFILNYTDESNPTISVIYPKKKIIYLNPNDTWSIDNPAYTVYSWGTAGSEFIPMESADCNGKVYMAEIDAAHTQVIFIRYNDFVTSFNSYWNRTNDLSLVAENPQFKITTWYSGDWIDGKETSNGEWEPYTPYYSISYDMNGHGQFIDDICIKKDDIWIAPDDPSAVGYTFLGWRRPAETGDNTLYKKGVAGFPVASDEELTAQWSFSMEYNITNTVPIYITSAVGQTIKATTPLTLTTSNMPIGTVINIAAPNIKFYHGSEEIKQLTNKHVSETFSLTIAYTPTADNTTEQPTITLSVLGNEKTFDGLISARSLPANFVIAAKWGNNWYAMPANMDSQSSTEGLLIEVDNPSDPTKALAAPNNAPYSLKSVKPGKFATQGERLVFVGIGDKTLYNAAGTSIQVYAQYANYDNDRYEWIPTTTDLKDYTLTSAAVLAGDGTGRTVSLDNHGIFGTLLQDKSYNGMVRLLPVDNFYEPIELQVVEWKQHSVSVMYTGAGTKYTTKVGNNAESSVQALSAIDHAVYSLSTSDLTTATNQPLIITIKNDADDTIGTVKLTIPAVVATDKSSTALGVTAEIAKTTSIVVLDGATLTADATKYTYDDITVYPGGKLVIGQSGQLGMYTLTLRAGSSWDAADYEHKYPQFVLNNSATGAYSNSSGQINLDYVTTKEQYYTFVAPFDVNTKDIKYPVDIYGSNNSGSFEFQYYDGEARAAGTPGWKVVEEGAEGATLKAGQGYTFLGMPKKINGTRQKYGIHRIPMKVAAITAQSHETADQTVPLSVHLSAKNNNSGWNLVGNPYMATVTGLTNSDIQVGKLVHTNDANGNWTGGWHWDDPTTGQRFLVIPSNDGQSYSAVQASHAALPAFKNFFVQISNTNANAMSIPVANREDKQLAPARHADTPLAHDIELAIVLEQDDAHADQLDFLLNDLYSAAFDFNGDFTKMMNATLLNLYGVHTDDNLSFVAVDHHTARQSIPIGYQVPAAGEYTLRMSDQPYVMWDEIEALYVTDHEMSPALTTDLMSMPYTFFVHQAETNNERFTLSVQTKAKTENGATDLDNVLSEGEQIHKFIYQDKIFILHHGVVYDATGKRVITINK